MITDADEVIPDLWIGSAPERAPDVDLLVLCAVEYQPYFSGVPILRCPLRDSPLPVSKDTFTRACDAAEKVAVALYEGKRVLVTCLQGRNRSGLVAAVALVLLTGCSGKDAMRLVQARRQDALTNPAFARLLRRLRGDRRQDLSARPVN